MGRSPGGGTGNPLQYSCLGNPIDNRAWQATVCGVAKRWTHLSVQAFDCLSRQGSPGIQTPWIPLLEIVSHPSPSFLSLLASHPQPYCLGVFLAATPLKSPLYTCPFRPLTCSLPSLLDMVFQKPLYTHWPSAGPGPSLPRPVLKAPTPSPRSWDHSPAQSPRLVLKWVIE